jgi:hypothetical protein
MIALAATRSGLTGDGADALRSARADLRVTARRWIVTARGAAHRQAVRQTRRSELDTLEHFTLERVESTLARKG